MTGPQYGGTPSGPWQPPTGPPPPFAPPPAQKQKQSRALTIASLIVAIFAIVVAIGSWFRPSANDATAQPNSPEYTAEEVQDAKTAVCEARELVNEAGTVAGNKTSDDPETRFVVAINSRLAGTAAADYLAFVYATHPAIPESLAQPLRDLISSHAQITLETLADTDIPALQPLFDRLDQSDAAVGRECD